jgi:hypothetical protein
MLKALPRDENYRLKPVPEKTKYGVRTCFEQHDGNAKCFVFCRFCKANAGCLRG